MGPIWSREKLPAEYMVLFGESPPLTEQVGLQSNVEGQGLFGGADYSLLGIPFCSKGKDAGQGQAADHASTTPPSLTA